MSEVDKVNLADKLTQFTEHVIDRFIFPGSGPRGAPQPSRVEIGARRDHPA